jgi:phosphoserine phosphatase
MTHVATLVCNPKSPVLTETLLRRARAALFRPQSPVWLDAGVAADIAFTPDPREGPQNGLKENAAAVRAALDGAPVDVIVQPAQGRRKSLLAADMDSTMIGQECIDELAAEVGMKPHVAAITERAMRGEIAFEAALRERVALLRGLHSDVIARMIETSITVTPGARALIQTMRGHGAHTALVSGGFTAFTQVIAKTIGFDADYANWLEMDSKGVFTGRVAEPIFGGDAKLATLLRLREAHGLAPAETLAVGDGANDLAMLREAGLGVAFHGKPAVAAAADARIDHADLTALLYAQGFTRAEFAGDPADARLN